jgi:hypothetical protein
MAADDSPFPKVLYPEWQNEYQAALLELDRQKLSERVAAAEAAIYKRLQAISQNSDHHAERQAIADALVGIRVLMKEKLEFPDWNTSNHTAAR